MVHDTENTSHLHNVAELILTLICLADDCVNIKITLEIKDQLRNEGKLGIEFPTFRKMPDSPPQYIILLKAYIETAYHLHNPLISE